MEDLHDFVVRSLNEAGRHQWQSIAEQTGISVHTIIKIARRDIESPRYINVRLLADYFEGRPEPQPPRAAA